MYGCYVIVCMCVCVSAQALRGFMWHADSPNALLYICLKHRTLTTDVCNELTNLPTVTVENVIDFRSCDWLPDNDCDYTQLPSLVPACYDHWIFSRWWLGLRYTCRHLKQICTGLKAILETELGWVLGELESVGAPGTAEETSCAGPSEGQCEPMLGGPCKPLAGTEACAPMPGRPCKPVASLGSPGAVCKPLLTLSVCYGRVGITDRRRGELESFLDQQGLRRWIQVTWQYHCYERE